MKRAPDASLTKHLLVLLPLLAAACSDPAASDSGADESTSLGSSSTTDGSTSTTDSTDGATTGDESPGLGEACDLYLQDCAAGLKCMPYADGTDPYWTNAACFPVVPEPQGLGEPCQWTDAAWSGYDNCGVGQLCWVNPFSVEGDLAGDCRGLCLNDDPANSDHTTYACEDTSATPTVLFPDYFCTCETLCNPLADECGEGRVCTFLEVFKCAADASGDTGVAGDPCEGYDECDSGHLCMGPDVIAGCEGPVSCCSPFCDVTQPNTCPGAAEGELCLQWYPPGEAPPGLENVGICRLPL